MSSSIAPQPHRATCPHDCPSTCALEVEVLGDGRIGRIHGARAQTYTAGVICAKVARYAERIHHPDRLMHPLKRTGPKGSGQFQPISWEAALDEVAAAFNAAEADYGSESIWPYHYGGTMGHVMRNGIHRLAHAKRYSRFYGTICTTIAWTGFAAGTGKIAGVDPREMAESDLIVIWGTNAVVTQVNVMTHAQRARKARGAKIAVVDIYDNATMQQADVKLILRPGTDAALACAVMHVLFRDGWADRAYMARYTDCPEALEAHLATRTPQWASAICGLSVAAIEDFAKLVGQTPRTFFRLGYGFSRSRNGAVQMHAAACIAAVAGHWQHKGGGVFFNNGALWKLNKTLIEGMDVCDPTTRRLDMSKIGAILNGDPEALKHGPPVKAMLIQNANPMTVAPDQTRVRQGFARDDLFTVVHEQFMTETAQMADIVLPATMFLEHDDVYTGGGHQHLSLSLKVIEPPGQCRSNHDVLVGIAERVGAHHRGFAMHPRAILDETLQVSGYGPLETFAEEMWRDLQPDFETSHYLNGFGHADKKFHFKVDWARVPHGNDGLVGDVAAMPSLPDHWAVIEERTDALPFRLATSPARHFLNSTFTETATSKARAGAPSLMIHPQDAADLQIVEDDLVHLGNGRGATVLRAHLFAGVQRGVVIAEGLFPNTDHVGGQGINVLTGADAVAPYGGVAFHDTAVWVKRAVDFAPS